MGKLSDILYDILKTTSEPARQRKEDKFRRDKQRKRKWIPSSQYRRKNKGKSPLRDHPKRRYN